MDRFVCKIENENYSTNNYQSESYIKEEIMLPDDIDCFDDEESTTENKHLQANLIWRPFKNEDKLIHIEPICNKNDTNFDEEIDVINVDERSEKLFVEAHKNKNIVENIGLNHLGAANFDNNSIRIDQCSIKMEVDMISLLESHLFDVTDHSGETFTLKSTKETRNLQVKINENLKENIMSKRKEYEKSQKQTSMFNFLKTTTSKASTLSSIANNFSKAIVNKDASKTTSQTFKVKSGVIPRKPLSTEFECPKCGIKMKKKGNMLRHKENCGILSECLKCGKKMIKTSLRQHMERCGITVRHLICKFCPLKTKCHYYMMKHVKEVHKDIKPQEYSNIIKTIIKKGEKIKDSFLNSPAAAEPIKMTKTNEYKKLILFFCTSCNETREYVDDMKMRDCQKCGNTTLLQCMKCTKRFPKKLSIFRHMGNKCAAEKRFQCADCEYSSTAKGNLEDHIRRRHMVVAPEDYEKCSKCDRRYKYRIERIKHEKNCGREEVLQCQLCPFKSKVKKYFKKHMQDHILHPTVPDAATPAPVDNVLIKVDNPKPLNRIAVLKVEKLTKAFCPKCEKIVKYVKHSKRQCSKCRTKLTYPCSKCTKVYLSFYKLRNHVISNHLIDSGLKKAQKCSACGKRFSLYYYLQRHQYTCCKQPDMQCDHCPFKTKYRSSIDKHLQRMHSETKTITRPSAVNSPKQFICTQCGKAYRYQCSLGQHEKYYCGKQPSLACDHCSFKAYMKNSLINHLQGVHKHLFTEQELWCRRCGKENINIYAHNIHVANCRFK